MAHNIGDNSTALATAAVGDKLKIYDASAAAEKAITVANLKKAGQAYVEETFTITTAIKSYAMTEVLGRNVWLFVDETNDEIHTITLPASGLVDGQIAKITHIKASTANCIFNEGGATAIVPTWTAAVALGQTHIYKYNATNDTWYGGILALA